MTDDEPGEHHDPEECPSCGTHNTEFVERDARVTGERIERRACNECYAGWEVEFEVSDVNIEVPPGGATDD